MKVRLSKRDQMIKVAIALCCLDLIPYFRQSFLRQAYMEFAFAKVAAFTNNHCLGQSKCTADALVH